ncbi:MAG: KH domain-containing protein, partial [Thermoplasmata archaeon]
MPVLYARIPEDRVGAVIGPGGATKRRIERATGATIEIDEDEEGIRVSSPDETDP